MKAARGRVDKGQREESGNIRHRKISLEKETGRALGWYNPPSGVGLGTEKSEEVKIAERDDQTREQVMRTTCILGQSSGNIVAEQASSPDRHRFIVNASSCSAPGTGSRISTRASRRGLIST